MTGSIYDITAEMKQLLDDAEKNEWDPQTIKDTLIGMGFEDKLDDYLAVITNKEATSDALKEEAAKLSARKKVYDNQVKRMKGAVLMCLQALGKTTHASNKATWSTRKGVQKLILSESEIPESYCSWDAVRTIDKSKIQEDLKSGKEVTGAHYEQQPETLSIRRK
ncbi:phage protein [Vibrio ishigakensis]|uniref:Phage protein n=1 Tax=Vibrio ishigakensis TaxID=1481914 RepID=A0A0B8PA01_9VIBR|nr:phage protein [Vibrio ishigakensis]